MKILRTFVPNSLGNYNHLAYCSVSREAAAVDPFNADQLFKLAKLHSLRISQIWITHEHPDHFSGLTQLKELTGASVYAPIACKGFFKAEHWLTDSQQFSLGKSTIKHYLTPGHLQGHGVFIFKDTIEPVNDFIISGDTLFNAGVGHVKSGDVTNLFKSITKLSRHLTPTSSIYSGHDYIQTNLEFTLNHCPDFTFAKTLLDQANRQTPDTRLVTTWAEEQQMNLFLNLDHPTVMNLTQSHELTDSARLNRFISLRTLRDQWQK